jgi:hypothetical protein
MDAAAAWQLDFPRMRVALAGGQERGWVVVRTNA